MASAKKVTFDFVKGNGTQFQAYWNGKEYAKGTVYISVSRVGSSTGGYQGSYSKEQKQFVNYKAGELDIIKAAAKALGFVE